MYVTNFGVKILNYNERRRLFLCCRMCRKYCHCSEIQIGLRGRKACWVFARTSEVADVSSKLHTVLSFSIQLTPSHKRKLFKAHFSINYSPADVDNVRLLLTRMMSDPTTKVFSLFLDTLYDFLNAHKLDLGSWLYTLLTRLFNKMSVELLPTVQAKLDRCFDLIRASFAAENQFQQLLKFVNDSLQTPNLKVS